MTGHEDHATVRCPEEAAPALEDVFSLLFKYMEDLSKIADYGRQEYQFSRQRLQTGAGELCFLCIGLIYSRKFQIVIYFCQTFYALQLRTNQQGTFSSHRLLVKYTEPIHVGEKKFSRFLTFHLTQICYFCHRILFYNMSFSQVISHLFAAL